MFIHHVSQPHCTDVIVPSRSLFQSFRPSAGYTCHFHSVEPANVQLNCLFVLICLSFFFQCSHIVAILSMQSFNSGGIFFLTKGKYCPWQLASNTIKLKKKSKKNFEKCCCSTCRMQKYFRLPSKIQYMMYNSSVIILNVNTNQ